MSDDSPPVPDSLTSPRSRHVKTLQSKIIQLLQPEPQHQQQKTPTSPADGNHLSREIPLSKLMNSFEILHHISQKEFEKMTMEQKSQLIQMVEQLAAESVVYLHQNNIMPQDRSQHQDASSATSLSLEALSNVLNHQRATRRREMRQQRREEIKATANPPEYVSIHRILFSFKESLLEQKHFNELEAFVKGNPLLRRRDFIRLYDGVRQGVSNQEMISLIPASNEKLRKATVVYQDLKSQGARSWAITMCIIIAVGNQYRKRYMPDSESSEHARQWFRKCIHDMREWNQKVRREYQTSSMSDSERLKRHVEAHLWMHSSLIPANGKERMWWNLKQEYSSRPLKHQLQTELAWVIDQMEKLKYSWEDMLSYLCQQYDAVFPETFSKLSIETVPQKRLFPLAKQEYRFLKHLQEIGKTIQIPESMLLEACENHRDLIRDKKLEEIYEVLQYDMIDAFSSYWKEIRYNLNKNPKRKIKSKL